MQGYIQSLEELMLEQQNMKSGELQQVYLFGYLRIVYSVISVHMFALMQQYALLCSMKMSSKVLVKE